MIRFKKYLYDHLPFCQRQSGTWLSSQQQNVPTFSVLTSLKASAISGHLPLKCTPPAKQTISFCTIRKESAAPKKRRHWSKRHKYLTRKDTVGSDLDPSHQHTVIKLYRSLSSHSLTLPCQKLRAAAEKNLYAPKQTPTSPHRARPSCHRRRLQQHLFH